MESRIQKLKYEYFFYANPILVSDSVHAISPQVITHAQLVSTRSGANVHVHATKTIQFSNAPSYYPFLQFQVLDFVLLLL